MKKIKRILAILGAIILAGLYISTIVCALSSNENYMDMLMASVYATVIIPVLIWAYSFVYKMVKKNHEQKEDYFSSAHFFIALLTAHMLSLA